MPELPEVETIRRDLEKEIVGKKIKTVDVKGLRSIRRHKTKKQFTGPLEGQKITSIDRKGKYLVLGLDSEDLLVIHLGMSGQLLRAANKDATVKHTHVTFTFTQGGQLRFIDPRTFGELFVTTPAELPAEAAELGHIGIDPLEDVVSWNVFQELLHSKKMKLKPFLMDQKIIAGIGNIYSDEILFTAGLRYDRTTDSLTSQEVRRLQRAMVEILTDAIKHRGSSLADEQYVDVFGEKGQYQAEHKVYNREGQPCRRCRTPIIKVKVSGRSHFLCEQCQV